MTGLERTWHPRDPVLPSAEACKGTLESTKQGVFYLLVQSDAQTEGPPFIRRLVLNADCTEAQGIALAQTHTGRLIQAKVLATATVPRTRIGKLLRTISEWSIPAAIGSSGFYKQLVREFRALPWRQESGHYEGVQMVTTNHVFDFLQARYPHLAGNHEVVEYLRSNLSPTPSC